MVDLWGDDLCRAGRYENLWPAWRYKNLWVTRYPKYIVGRLRVVYEKFVGKDCTTHRVRLHHIWFDSLYLVIVTSIPHFACRNGPPGLSQRFSCSVILVGRFLFINCQAIPDETSIAILSGDCTEIRTHGQRKARWGQNELVSKITNYKSRYNASKELHWATC